MGLYMMVMCYRATNISSCRLLAHVVGMLPAQEGSEKVVALGFRNFEWGCQGGWTNRSTSMMDVLPAKKSLESLVPPL